MGVEHRFSTSLNPFFMITHVTSRSDKFIFSMLLNLFSVVTYVTLTSVKYGFGTLSNLFSVVTHVTSIDEESVFGTSLNFAHCLMEMMLLLNRFNGIGGPAVIGSGV